MTQPSETTRPARWAGLMAACALLVLPAGSAGAAAGDRGAAASARAAFAQVRGALAGATVASSRGFDLNAAFRDLALSRGALPRAERRQARSLLLRPSGPRQNSSDAIRYPSGSDAPESPLCTSRVCIHWTDQGKHAPPAADRNGSEDGDGVPDYVESVRAAVRRSTEVENGRLGWRRPKGDGKVGEPQSQPKRGRADIYLLDLGDSIAGFTTVDPAGKGRRRSGWVAVDNDFGGQGNGALTLMQVTVAHEYSHLVQYAYDVAQEPWLYESTATWIEDRVFPSANLYLGFVRDFARAPGAPLDSAATMYGAATLHQFVADRGGAKAVRNVWERSRRFTGTGRGYRALNAGLRQAGLRLQSLFARFAATSAVWRDHPAFPDAGLLPRVRRSKTIRPGRRLRTRLSRMAYAIVPIGGKRAAEGIRIRFKGPKKGRAFAALTSERGGRMRIDSVAKLRRGKRVMRLRRPGRAAKIEAVIVNTDFRRDPSSRFEYRGDRRRFKVSVR